MALDHKKLASLLEEWAIKENIRRNYSEKNLKKKREFMNRFLRIFGTKEFTPENLNQYVDRLREKGSHPQEESSKPWKVSSLITEIQMIRAFITWLHDRQYLEHNFGKLVIKPKSEHEPKEMISLELALEIAKMSNEILPTDNKLVVRQKKERKFFTLILLFTSTRKSELLSVSGKDLFLDVIQPYMVLKRKGGKWDKVPLPPWSIEILRDRKEWKRVFNTHPDSVGREWKKTLIKAGIKESIPLHRFRHMTTTELIDNGASPANVQQLMAHKDLSVTLGIYRDNSVKTKADTELLYNPLWRKDTDPQKTIDYLLSLIQGSGVKNDPRFTTSLKQDSNGISFSIAMNPQAMSSPLPAKLSGFM